MTLKQRIKEHFDIVSLFYHELWGVHIHHGYWKRGTESKKKAQEQLIDELVERSSMGRRAKVLDVGCGIGGTALYLSKKLDAKVTGITLSPVQAEIARSLARRRNIDAKFHIMDGERITLTEKYDVVWEVEVISHYYDQENFFSSARRLLRPGGKVVMAEWLKAEHLTKEQEKRDIRPIESGMLLPGLATMKHYIDYLHRNGFRLLSAEDASPHTSKTWDLCLDIIRNPRLWKIAAKHGKDVVAFLRSFRDMQRAYKNRTFVYGIFVAEKVK